MAVSRRRLFRSLAITAGVATAAKGAEPATSMEALRNVSAAQGKQLSDDRLRIVKPVIEQRRGQLQVLRDFPVDDKVAPTQGIVKR